MRVASTLFCLTFLVLPPLAKAEVDFEKELLPVLEAKCVQCHKATHEDKGRTIKPKAGLRFDAAWAIEAGSEDGPVVVAGKSGESSMFERVTLPQDDDDFMPPVGKADPLTPEEIAILKRWIDEGADFGEWAGNLEGKPAETTSTSTSTSTSARAPVSVSEIQLVYQRLAEGLPQSEEKSWESVTGSGGRVMRLAQSSPLLAVDFRLASTEAGDEAILSAKSIAGHIAHLDLSRTAATDAALALVADTPRLVRLDLSNTGIGDAGLASLKGLKEIRYLNLHNTAATDAGLKHLAELGSLESIYLWQSKVTEAGVKKLRDALPDAKVNFK